MVPEFKQCSDFSKDTHALYMAHVIISFQLQLVLYSSCSTKMAIERGTIKNKSCIGQPADYLYNARFVDLCTEALSK